MTSARWTAMAIFGPDGNLHIDKIMRSKEECWGLLGEELDDKEHWTSEMQKHTAKSMKARGYTCRRVSIKPVSP